MTIKLCKKCSETKPRGDFHANKTMRDGLSSKCKACAIVAAREWAIKNPERRREIHSAWLERNAASEIAKAKQHYAANKDAVKAKVKKWRTDNPDRVLQAQRDWRAKRLDLARHYAREYTRNNLDKMQVHTAARRARKLNATPVWANKEKIREYYVSANGLRMLTGEWYHVDHIVPLRGKTVCGLHNEFNLQILPASENISKNNRHWPDMPI